MMLICWSRREVTGSSRSVRSRLGNLVAVLPSAPWLSSLHRRDVLRANAAVMPGLAWPAICSIFVLDNSPTIAYSPMYPPHLRASSGRPYRQAEGERFLRAGLVIPHSGVPVDTPAITSWTCERTHSLNGFRATGARKCGRFTKNAAVERRKARTPRHGVRDAASWRLQRAASWHVEVPRHGTSGCGDPHPRLSALRPPRGGNEKAHGRGGGSCTRRGGALAV
jgi:hypothetical protein